MDEFVERTLAGIGSEIKRLREEKGISQKEIATRTGVAQKTISRIENGLDNPTVVTLLKIGDELGATVYLVPRQDNEGK